MRDDRFSTTASKPVAGDARRRARRPGEFEQTGRAPGRTFGVYDRPARRTKLSPSFVVILILSVLVCFAAAARFLF